MEGRREKEIESSPRRHLRLKAATFVKQKAFGTSRPTFFHQHDSTDAAALRDNGLVAGFRGEQYGR